MLSSVVESSPAFVPQALAASGVGTWQTHVEAGCIIADAASAALFGFEPADAAAGLPITAYQDRVHAADRAEILRRHEHLSEKGGLYVFEYRTVPRPGEVRRVLVRGRYSRDAGTGAMIGQGIMIDITESKDQDAFGARTFLAAPDPATGLDCVAAHAIDARHAIDALEKPARNALRPPVDALLLAVGRILARTGKGPAT